MKRQETGREYGMGILRWIVMIVVLMMVLSLTVIHVYAGEAENFAINGEIKQTEADMPAREEKDLNAPVVAEFKSGSSMFVTAEDAEWYEVFYQGKTLYVEKNPPAEDIADKDAITKEMMSQQETDAAWVEQYAAEEKARTNSRTWRIVIGVVIGACVIASVVLNVAKKKAGEER